MLIWYTPGLFRFLVCDFLIPPGFKHSIDLSSMLSDDPISLFEVSFFDCIKLLVIFILQFLELTPNSCNEFINVLGLLSQCSHILFIFGS